jgi:Ca2+-binding RTX toxin-like protein
VLVGGPGAITLTGGTGRDILIGGGGPASLHAGTAEHILIGGSTSYDANMAALAALVAEWSRPDVAYADRVHALLQGGTGTSNGAFVLDDLTVTPQAGKSQLTGGTAQDWFWLSEKPKGPDTISGFTNGEVATVE